MKYSVWTGVRKGRVPLAKFLAPLRGAIRAVAEYAYNR
jgi:hypothetical protein